MNVGMVIKNKFSERVVWIMDKETIKEDGVDKTIFVMNTGERVEESQLNASWVELGSWEDR
jgi:hypothetical protein